MVRRSRDVIEAWDVTVDALVNTKEPEQVGWRFVGCCASFPFPEGGTKIVTLGEDRSFTDVEAVSDGIKMKEPPREL
jgi:hypothetical protein